MKQWEDLYHYLISHTNRLTEGWYATLKKGESAGIYASTAAENVQLLKKQYNKLHRYFFQIFSEEKTTSAKIFKEWVVELASDPGYLATPIHEVLKELYRTRDEYMKLVREFASLHRGEYSQEDIDQWNYMIIDTMDKVTTLFTEEHNRILAKNYQAHREMIYELSAPVIMINEKTGLLPLIGEIDHSRAKFIIEKTLKQCAQKNIDCLFIDLSGVVAIDGEVAQRLFQLHEALGLIGVKTTLSGVRPEVAQTAVQLGLSFNKIPVTSTLSRALNYNPENL
ncbi:STAS domain-containing protein [Domibacillus robiginosus]|uniref:STAS domain-containing protein n=1 Tax=Domibacillus robiginosus TaxID=1071054 RepID=UPI00067BE9BD|nr:STAS domain-containing protein [Domibacillus robiginosus]